MFTSKEKGNVEHQRTLNTFNTFTCFQPKSEFKRCILSFVKCGQVTNVPESSMHTLIDELISTHPAEFQMESKLWYSVLYMAMVSEENYRNTKLGKRLKRLGVHQFLIEGMPVVDAANWSRGKRWREIAAECEKFGF